MNKLPPVTPSFIAWQRAAGSLLTLETALSRTRRAVPEAEKAGADELEKMVATMRLTADGLFRAALAEVKPETRPMARVSARRASSTHAR